jgi:hypothetical protein
MHGGLRGHLADLPACANLVGAAVVRQLKRREFDAVLYKEAILLATTFIADHTIMCGIASRGNAGILHDAYAQGRILSEINVDATVGFGNAIYPADRGREGWHCRHSPADRDQQAGDSN